MLYCYGISDEKTTEGISRELTYIEENYDLIINLLKSYNKDNDILFIANNGVTSSKLTIYNVPIDKNDTVARNPICENSVLYNKFSNVELPDKDENIKRYLAKEKNKKRLQNRIKRKLKFTYKKLFFKQYSHENQY